MSDHPNMRGRDRSEDPARRPPRSVPAPADARQLSRSRLPLPPVPAPARAAARPSAAPSASAAPRTTAAPFQAVPSPEPLADLALDDVRSSPVAAQVASAPAAPPLERRKRPRSSSGAPERPRSTWHESESAFVATGGSGLRASGSAPRVPRQTTSAGSSAPAYGDWTKPSRSGEEPQLDDGPLMAPEAFDHAPGTTAIPERPIARRRGKDIAPADRQDEESEVEMTAVRGPGTGPVMGGRAAQRAERQAADAARRKAQKQRGSAVAVLEDEAQGRKSHRVIKGLLAMTVVALGVLGVYTVVSPPTTEAASQAASPPSTAPSLAAPADPLPELPTAPVEIEPVVTVPVRVPVTVLNSTTITGLAAKIAGTIVASGWESPGVGAYTAGDIAASTVYFTEGDETQRQAAVQLIEQFPQLQGPTPRFFELPAELVTPGLVVVAAGDWQP